MDVVPAIAEEQDQRHQERGCKSGDRQPGSGEA